MVYICFRTFDCIFLFCRLLPSVVVAVWFRRVRCSFRPENLAVGALITFFSFHFLRTRSVVLSGICLLVTWFRSSFAGFTKKYTLHKLVMFQIQVYLQLGRYFDFLIIYFLAFPSSYTFRVSFSSSSSSSLLSLAGGHNLLSLSFFTFSLLFGLGFCTCEPKATRQQHNCSFQTEVCNTRCL